MAAAMATLPLLTRLPTPRRHALTKHKLPLSPPLRRSLAFSPLIRTKTKFDSKWTITCAYVTGPASDPIFSEPDQKIDESDSPSEEIHSPLSLITWGLLWSLLLKHKLRLGLSVLTLVGCTTCTLSMPIFSGRFFEVLIGARPDPLWRLLSKVGLLYALEPIFTVVFVINMNTVWEKVMATVRAQIFRRVLIQKAEFFDRYKVGELSGLLTSDLGSLKALVSENISRDRGFRALSEVIGTICILFTIAPQLAPILGILMLTVSVLVAVYKRSTVPVFKAHGLAQASISDCVTETFSAIRTVRSFGGEKRQMLMFGGQVLAYQRSGIKLGTFKSLNESLTRVAIYISLLALYCLGGSKVKAQLKALCNATRIMHGIDLVVLSNFLL